MLIEKKTKMPHHFIVGMFKQEEGRREGRIFWGDEIFPRLREQITPHIFSLSSYMDTKVTLVDKKVEDEA